MLLSCLMLENVASVNDFDVVDRMEFNEGDAPAIYLQLIDANKRRSCQGYVPTGLRYMPADDATLQVTIENVNAAKKIVRLAEQPFAQDPSIWKLSLMPADSVAGTLNLRLLLTEPAGLSTKVTNGYVSAAVAVRSATGRL